MDNDRSRYHRYNPTIRRIQTAKTREPVLLQSDTGEAFLQSLCSMEYLGPGAEDVSPQAAAGILVERLKHSGHLGDRREALDALLALSKKHPGEVGLASGMPTFTDILQAGVADGAMTQTIMEIMINLVSERDRDVAAAGGDDVRVGVNIDAFLRDVQNVQNLLDLLESQDTLTAMSAVQASAMGSKFGAGRECFIYLCTPLVVCLFALSKSRYALHRHTESLVLYNGTVIIHTYNVVSCMVSPRVSVRAPTAKTRHGRTAFRVIRIGVSTDS